MTKGTLLGFRACVLRGAAVGCKSADVADADRVGVVTAAMGSVDVFWTGGLDGAVDGDDVVIAAACPTEGSVVTVDVCHPQFAACLVGGAMNDNKGDFSHKHNFFCFGVEQQSSAIKQQLKEIIFSNCRYIADNAVQEKVVRAGS